MGLIVSKGMEKAAQKQREFMLESQKMQLERQIEMQNQMRIRMQAVAIARARDAFTYVGTFYGLLGIGLFAATLKKKNGAFLFPMVPLSVIVGYVWDLAWGDKVPRCIGWAEEIIAHEPHLLTAPHGMPGVEDIDRAIKARKLSSEL